MLAIVYVYVVCYVSNFLQLPYNTIKLRIKSYFCGVMVFCQEQLAQVAYGVRHMDSGVLDDEVCEEVACGGGGWVGCE